MKTSPMKRGEPYRVRSERRSTCLVCKGSRLSRVMFRIYGYEVSRCRDCGSRFLNPSPTEATLLALHVADSFAINGTANNDARVSQLKRATAKLYLDLLSQHAGIEGGRLLDIGCGRGELLIEARARGFETTGIDVAPHAASVANQRLGEDLVSVGAIESVTPPEDSFDVVILADVLGHIREPLPVLRRVHNVLRPGGAVLVVTSSLDSWSARLMRRYWMEYMPQHVLYFSSRSLRVALETTGFASVTIVPNMKVLDLDYICHRFQRLPVAMLTPALRLVRSLAPEEWAYHEVQMVAGGIAAIARKSDDMTMLADPAMLGVSESKTASLVHNEKRYPRLSVVRRLPALVGHLRPRRLEIGIGRRLREGGKRG